MFKLMKLILFLIINMYDVVDYFEFYPHPTLLELGTSHENSFIFAIKEPDNNVQSKLPVLFFITFGIFSKILSSHKLDIAMKRLFTKIAIKILDIYYNDYEEYDIFTKTCNLQPPKMESILEEEELKTEPKLPYLEEIKSLKKNSLSTESLKTIELSENEQESDNEDTFHKGWIDIQN